MRTEGAQLEKNDFSQEAGSDLSQEMGAGGRGCCQGEARESVGSSLSGSLEPGAVLALQGPQNWLARPLSAYLPWGPTTMW